MATTPYLEMNEPAVQYNGLNSAKNVDFSGSTSVTLPSGTTIGGSSVVSLSSVSNAITTGALLSLVTSGVYTGTGGLILTADSATTGTILAVSGAGLTTGHAAVITAAGTITTTGDALSVIANSATTSTGIVRVSATALTSGFAMAITSGGAALTTGGALNISNGASTAGTAVVVTSTGVMTTTAGLLTLTGNSATTASGLLRVNGLGITTGLLAQLNATAATLTTGRYLSANDAAGEVFGIGANGHLHSTVGATPPTIVVTTQAGITAAAITAGGSDTAGVITTTGTSTGATQLTVTFNKTYTTAPKTVCLTPANAAAAMPNTGYLVDLITATTFRITVAAGGTYAATPSWYYQVIA